MPARLLVCRDSETLARYPPLELGWKESIVTSHENAGWHGRPHLETAGRSKHGVRLRRFSLCPGVVDHRLRHVVEKVDERVERSVGATTVAHVLSAFRVPMASICPPLTRSFAGLRDHRIDQHEHRHPYFFAHQRQRKT